MKLSWFRKQVCVEKRRIKDWLDTSHFIEHNYKTGADEYISNREVIYAIIILFGLAYVFLVGLISIYSFILNIIIGMF